VTQIVWAPQAIQDVEAIRAHVATHEPVDGFALLNRRGLSRALGRQAAWQDVARGLRQHDVHQCLTARQAGRPRGLDLTTSHALDPRAEDLAVLARRVRGRAALSRLRRWPCRDPCG
jgi:plasmid stabilization system protein ParE